MIPMKTSSVFKNRWMALLWAAGIIWFAYDIAGSAPQGDENGANSEAPTDATGAPISADDAKKLGAALNAF